jgi:hypothetical protein
MKNIYENQPPPSTEKFKKYSESQINRNRLSKTGIMQSESLRLLFKKLNITEEEIYEMNKNQFSITDQRLKNLNRQ